MRFVKFEGRQAGRFVLASGALAIVVACGGGGSSNSNSNAPVVEPVVKRTSAEVNLPDGKAQWSISTPIAVTLRDPDGNKVTGNLACSSKDVQALEVSSDCQSIKALRIGSYAFTVSGGGFSADVTVKNIPQRHPLAAAMLNGGNGGGTSFGVVDSAGGSYFWGINDFGDLAQLVKSGVLKESLLPIKGKLASGIVQLASGEISSAALDESGEVWTWGSSAHDVLGRDLVDESHIPGRVSNSSSTGGLGRIVQVGTGSWNTAALGDDGYVYAWGWGYTVGRGQNADGKRPQRVTLPDGTPLGEVVQIAVGGDFSLALKRDGRVFGWGKNKNSVGNSNQTGSGLGDEYVFHAYPVLKRDKTPITDIVSISAGYENGLALTSEGKVYVWGANDSFELSAAPIGGSSLAQYVKSPDGLGDLSNIKAILCGQYRSYVLASDGKIFSWGRAVNGLLGEGELAKAGNNRQLPRAVVDVGGSLPISNAVAIAATYQSAFALLADGTIAAWGLNSGGVLGQNTSDPKVMFSTATPKLVLNASGAGYFRLENLGAYPNLVRRGRW